MKTIQMAEVEQLVKKYLATQTEVLAAMFSINPLGTAELLKTQREDQRNLLGELIDSMTPDQFGLFEGDEHRMGFAAQFAAA